MSTETVQLPVKVRGSKRYFPEDIEDQISRLYYDDDLSSHEIARRFAPLTKGNKLAESTVRLIAKRSRERRAQKSKAPQETPGGLSSSTEADGPTVQQHDGTPASAPTQE